MSARAGLAARCSALALTLAFVLTGCGSPAAVPVAHHELRLRLREFQILPQSVSVPAGRLKIVAYNAGILTHNVVIELPSSDSSGNPIVLAGIPTILPHHTGQPIKVMLKPGKYLLVSTIANQADLGMRSTLIVRSH